MSGPPPVLVVEDDPTIARALTRELARSGRTALLFENVADALSSTEYYETAIIDLNLPDGSGLDIANELLTRGQLEHAVFFSATTDQHEVERAEMLGRFITKQAGVTAAVDAALELAPVSGAQSGPVAPRSETRPSSPLVLSIPPLKGRSR